MALPTDDPWDRAPNQEPAKAQDEIITRLARSSSVARARVLSDQNATVPRPEKFFNPRTNQTSYRYESAPVPLARLFGSPLVMSGTYARGPARERLIMSGYGDPRSTAYGKDANRAGLHGGLDFTAPYGETLLATGDGTVRFVGYQGKTGPAAVSGLTTDDAKAEIYNAKGEVVASKALDNIGFGGVCVWIDHTGDFQGYRSEYYHLSEVHVKYGQKVLEGDPIGKVGGTGGYYNWFRKGYHLHFQIAYIAGGLRAIVRPTAMIPNYWPKHEDSTTAGVAGNLIMPALESMGLQTAAGHAAVMLSALDRGTSIQNQQYGTLKTGHATYAERVAQTLDVRQSAMHAAVAGFQGKAPLVEAPLTFDFSNGVWSVGGNVKGPL